MSLEKKDVHVRLEEGIHSRLSVLAGLDNSGIAEHAAYLLFAFHSKPQPVRSVNDVCHFNGNMVTEIFI